MKINGIVLAAGFGKRLMPLTSKIPKPLLPVAGRPLLEIAAERLFEAGAEKLAVNAHHLAPLIDSFVSGGPLRDKIQLFHEREILGTGGPLVNAKALLASADAFLLHNGDVYSDIDIKELLRRHLESGAVATMAVVDGPENRLLVAGETVHDILGKLGVAAPPGARLLTYACVAAFSPEIFDYLPERPVFCSLIDGILKAMAAKPGSVRCFAPEKPLWSDIGSFEQYFQIHERLLSGSGRPFRFGPDGDGKAPDGVALSGFVSASGSFDAEPGSALCNCVLLEGAKIRSGERRRNEVIGPDFSVHRDQPELAKLKILERLPSGWSASGLVEQGSSRRFYHIRMPDGSSQALMTSSKEDQDFQRFLDIGDFFAKAELRTPRLFARVPEEYAVLMEFLGDDTLYDLVKAARNRSEVLDLYEKVVDALADFQTRGTALLDEGGLELRVFDGAYLRWESAYFMEHFVAGLCRLSPDPAARRAVDAELDALAERALAMPRSLMHRDFQSQNILLPDEEPRFVDFQGARLGPYVYDIASLLKDPYVSLPRDLRDSLRARHFEALKSSGWLPGRVDFRSYLADYNRASLQRNMQALGAYGFLSLKKRKAKYLAYARPCLELLLEGLAEAKELQAPLPALEKLCDEASEALSSGSEAAAKALAGVV